MERAAKKPKSIQRREVADYSFAFNERRFSDRTLRIAISMDPHEVTYDGATCLHQDDDSNGAIEVRTVQVNSTILAESSQFFNKLFSSGMRETEQRHATIHISPSEEQAFIYLLKFMYGGTIQTLSIKVLLDVLMLADKFEVASCIDGCTNALDSMPVTMEIASLILCLPSSLLPTDVMKPIVKAAEGFLLTQFSERTLEEEYMNLPLHIIEKVLESDELHVASEEYSYDFAINWANRHYHNQDERKEVFHNKLIKLIRFPQMTDSKLAEILSNEDMHSASALKFISEALNFKGGCSSESYNLEDKRFCKRSYMQIPIRVIKLHTPTREYRVFCDFCIDECQVEEVQRSQTFYMWGREHSLICTQYCLFVEPRLPMEYVVFLRSKLSNHFCEVSQGDLNSDIMLYAYEDANDLEDYSFNNVIYVQVVFT